MRRRMTKQWPYLSTGGKTLSTDRTCVSVSASAILHVMMYQLLISGQDLVISTAHAGLWRQVAHTNRCNIYSYVEENNWLAVIHCI